MIPQLQRDTIKKGLVSVHFRNHHISDDHPIPTEWVQRLRTLGRVKTCADWDEKIYLMLEDQEYSQWACERACVLYAKFIRARVACFVPQCMIDVVAEAGMMGDMEGSIKICRECAVRYKRRYDMPQPERLGYAMSFAKEAR